MTKPTITRVPTRSVIIVRDGQRLAPPVGKGFLFTADEIKSVEDVDPEALREPKDETVATTADAGDTGESGETGDPKPAAKGGKKTPPSKTDDDEGL